MVYLYEPQREIIDIDGYQPQRFVLLSFSRDHLVKIIRRLFALPASNVAKATAFYFLEVNSSQVATLKLHGVKTIATGRFVAMQAFKLGLLDEQQKQLF